MEVISHHDMGMDAPAVSFARLAERCLKGVRCPDRREHRQPIISAIDHMVERTFELYTTTAWHTRDQSKPGHVRQSREYPIQGIAAWSLATSALDAFQLTTHPHHALA